MQKLSKVLTPLVAKRTYNQTYLQSALLQMKFHRPSLYTSYNARFFTSNPLDDEKTKKEKLESACLVGGGTEREYCFESKRLTISSFKNPKSDKVSQIQIDGKDRSVSLLTNEKTKLSLEELKRRTVHVLTETYLPKDYPESVSKEYLPFTIASTIGQTSTAAMLFLSTQSLFVALGGSQTQSQLAAAAYTWVLKDGLGQLGAIFFASRYGGKFDEDIKKWRFFAMFSLNAAILIEIMTLNFPHLFLLLASTANMGKNICFLMAAASRAQINMRFAKRNNIADIAGKTVSLFTTSSLVGMGIGIGLSKLIDISQLSHLMPVFGVLTFINLYSTYTSASLIDEVYLNNQRSKLFFDEFLKEGNTETPSMKSINDMSTFTVPNFMNRHYCSFIKFGVNPISHVMGMGKPLQAGEPNYYVNSLLHQLHKENRKFVYYVSMLPYHKRPFCKINNNNRPYLIHMNMRKDAENPDQLAAYYFARLLDIELQKMFEKESLGEGNHDYQQFQNAIRLAEIHFSQVDISQFITELEEQEWSLEYIYLDRKNNRYEYKLEHVQEESLDQVPEPKLQEETLNE